MSERDPMHDLLREWTSPEPGRDFDGRVANAYRAEFRIERLRQPALRRLWTARIGVPVPVLLAIVAAIALFFWLRPAAAPGPADLPSSVLTRLNVNGFQPLPNGEAQVVPVRTTQAKEAH